MAKRPFKIVPDEEVGKTEILYKGDERHLKELKEHFSSIESSEVYPSFDEDFRFTMFFRNTSDAFLSKLFRYCKEKLPRLEGHEEGLPIWLYLKWSAITFIVICVLYFAFMLYNTVMVTKETIQKPNNPEVELQQ